MPVYESKRKGVSIKALRAKYDRGEDTSRDRALIRMGMTMTQVAIGADDLSEWDDEELAMGQRRSTTGKFKGTFQGKRPVVIPKRMHDELVRRTLSRANELMRENLVAAIEVLAEIVKDPTAEDKDRLTAIRMIVDRVMGKEPTKVELTGEAPWMVALQAGIVSIQSPDILGTQGEEDYEDADLLEDDDG